jgi:hypothetical protein
MYVATVRSYQNYGVILRRLQNIMWSFLRPLAEHQMHWLVSSSDFLFRFSEKDYFIVYIDTFQSGKVKLNL